MSVGLAFDAALHTPAHLLWVMSHDPEDFLVLFELPGHHDNVVRLGSLTIDGVAFTIKPWHEDDHAVHQDFMLHVRVVIEKMLLQMWSLEGTAEVLGVNCIIDRLDTRTHECGHTRTFACWVWVWDVAFIATKHTIWRAARVETMMGASPPSREVAPPPPASSSTSCSSTSTAWKKAGHAAPTGQWGRARRAKQQPLHRSSGATHPCSTDPPHPSTPKTRASATPIRKSARQACAGHKAPVAQRASLLLVKKLGLLGPKEAMTAKAAKALIKRFDEALTDEDIAIIAKLTRLEPEALRITGGTAGPDAVADSLV
ncbi:uncharacterized protein [Aegilops tauschii subsp. strangulata]|uniref:uncharacterized protein n=1 Tax=Aegilops tauschii subsp. strangulata TaxID=200361 RepID=UPI003CC86948